MTSYLVQSICLDAAAGRPVAVLPVDPACTHRRAQTLDDRATYRKHDWPDQSDPRHPLTGYQASDSVVDPAGATPLIIQTFDFGDTHRVFGRFDGDGDGGQAVLLTNGWASIAMTEDGGDGVQWFISDDCRTTPKPERHFFGWLLFDNDVTNQWADHVTRLNKERSPTACPGQFNSAYTRYRTEQIWFPFRIVDRALKLDRYLLDVVISEHFGARRIADADHMERFYFARNLGLVRWERWAHRTLWFNGGVDSAAERLAQSERCPRLDPEESLDGDWKRLDCRTWTTLVVQHDAWSVADYRWEAPHLLHRLGAGPGSANAGAEPQTP